MNKIFVILTALILSGCATKLTQLNVPTQLEHNGKNYALTGSQDLETIARYVYIAKPDTLENWQSEIEQLKEFDLGGYWFDSASSTETEFVFKRDINE